MCNAKVSLAIKFKNRLIQVRPIPCVYDVRAEYLQRQSLDGQFRRIPIAIGNEEVNDILNGNERRSSVGPVVIIMLNVRRQLA